MSKVVLVMDKPETCWDCKLYQLDSRFGARCVVNESGVTIEPHRRVQEWCSLREMPEEVDIENEIHSRDYEPDFDGGWNACIKEILGE